MIAIARNFRRSRQQELAPLQITNTFLRNRNNRLSKLVEKQQYDLVEGTIHSIISSIEYDEEREKKCIEYNEEKENLIINYEVKQTMSDMIHHIENIQTQPTVINEHPSYKVKLFLKDIAIVSIFSCCRC